MENVVINIPLTIDPPLTDERAIEFMTQGLEKLMKVGALKGDLDEILLDYEVDIPNKLCRAVLTPDSLYDASKLTTIGASLSSTVLDNTSEVDTSESVKEFSAAGINEKVRANSLDPKIRFRNLIIDYSRYYTQMRSKLEADTERMRVLKNTFTHDIMNLILDLRPYIMSGKMLNSMLGVSQVIPTAGKVSKELSGILKRAFKVEENSSQIPKTIYVSLKRVFNDFIDEITSQIFPGMGDILAEAPVDTDLGMPDDYTEDFDLFDDIKEFSASSINERLRVSKMDKKLRFRYLITDYKRYYAQKRKQLEDKPEQMKMLRNMFLQDIMGIFTEILPYIEQGKQLNTLLGVSQVTPTVNKQARDLSLIYRRALKAEKSSGQIPKTVYQSLKKAYTEFINALIPQVFPGMEEVLSGKSEEPVEEITEKTTNAGSKNYSYTREGRIRLF